MTKWSVILSAEHERIRNTLRGETDCRGAKAPRNDKATAYRTHLAAFVATKWCVILNAKRERIRNSHFKRKRIATAVIRLRNDGGGETDCHAPFGARNDRTAVNCTFTVVAMTGSYQSF